MERTKTRTRALSICTCAALQKIYRHLARYTKACLYVDASPAVTQQVKIAPQMLLLLKLKISAFPALPHAIPALISMGAVVEIRHSARNGASHANRAALSDSFSTAVAREPRHPIPSTAQSAPAPAPRGTTFSETAPAILPRTASPACHAQRRVPRATT
jgi:hypothetical protein